MAPWRTTWVLKTMIKYLEWVGGLGVLGVTRHLSGLEAVVDAVRHLNQSFIPGASVADVRELLSELTKTSRDWNLPCEGRLWLESLRKGIELEIPSDLDGPSTLRAMYAFGVCVQDVWEAISTQVGVGTEALLVWALQQGYYESADETQFARLILIKYLSSINYDFIFFVLNKPR